MSAIQVQKFNGTVVDFFSARVENTAKDIVLDCGNYDMQVVFNRSAFRNYDDYVDFCNNLEKGKRITVYKGTVMDEGKRSGIYYVYAYEIGYSQAGRRKVYDT